MLPFDRSALPAPLFRNLLDKPYNHGDAHRSGAAVAAPGTDDACETPCVMDQDPYIGKKLGRFLIQEKIGSGGMGTVYRALQEGLDRTAAVKVLHGERRGGTFQKRFVREARSAAQVSHPNVVQVYTAGVAETIPFLAMEFLDGTSIGERLDSEGRIPEGEAVAIARQAARGLQAAARQHLIHRDVKPDNLVITSDGTVKVADFGLAKDTEAHTRLTQDKVTIGTIAYMSPEQIRGETLDVRSDIYALGATLYHMVSGRPPFVGEGAVVLAYKHLNDPVPLLRSAFASASAGVEAVIHRMMAKKPEDRYSGYEALLEDLDHLAASGSPALRETLAFHDRILIEDRGPVRSRRFLLALAAGGLVIAAGVILLASFLGGRKGTGEGAVSPSTPATDPPIEIRRPAEGAVLPSPRTEVKGSVDPTRVVSLEINGQAVPIVGGRFSLDVWLDPASPALAWTARLAGGEERTGTMSLRVDAEAPRIVVDEPAGGTRHTRADKVRLEGRFLDRHPGPFRVDGAVVPLREGRFSLDIPLAGEGERRVRLEGEDRAGHRAETTVILVRDLTPPRIVFHDFERFIEGGDGTLSACFKVTDEASPIAGVSLNGEELPGSGPLFERKIDLAEGVNELRVQARDAAGNVVERVEQTHYRPSRPPTMQKLREEYDRVVAEAREADPEKRIRILETYVASHPESPFRRGAEALIEKAREALKSRREREAFENVKERAEAAAERDPFEAIAIWNAFLETSGEGPEAEKAEAAREALRRRGIEQDGVARGDKPGVYVNLEDGAEMVFVPGGRFLRGLPKLWKKTLDNRYIGSFDTGDEVPAFEVYVDGFYLYRHEVTNAQFARFLGTRRSDKDDEGRPLLKAHPLGLVKEGGRWKPATGRERHPAICVSWYGAKAYAAWAGGALPKEAQWEKAASWDAETGTKRIFPWGDTYRHGRVVCVDFWRGREIRSTTELDIFLQKEGGDLHRTPRPVDAMAEGASPCGCLHMAGNVWEWCLDVYDKEFYRSGDSRMRNPCRLGKGATRVIRGGGWKDMGRDARTTNRDGYKPAAVNEALGFRVAR